MAIAAYIAWLIVKIVLFSLVLLFVLFFGLMIMVDTEVLDVQKAQTIEEITVKYLNTPVSIFLGLTPLCLVFLLGLWLFAPEYLP